MRWTWVVALVGLGLPGCSVGPTFGLVGEAKRTCSADFLSWTGGLTYHVSQGPGDGTFTYDPAGDLVDEVDGFYDLKTGDFSWVTTYADDSFHTSDLVIGHGTLWRDGDLDVTYESTAAYTDDTEETTTVRTQRYGCDEVTQVEGDDGVLSVVEGTYTSSSFDYVREWIYGPIVVEAEGSIATDGSWEESEDLEDGALVASYDEEGDGAGEVTRTFHMDDGVIDIEGSWERSRDGAVSFDYTSKPRGIKKELWNYTVDAEGDGDGTWEQDGVTCDLVLDDHDCSRKRCSAEGYDGACEPLVEAPKF